MWSENKVRIKDIAEELGVSTATVSNVLHGKTEKISERTVKVVEKKLEERGYIPNMAATLLARNNSRIIGVIVNDHEKYEGHVFEDSFIAAAIDFLSDEIERRGYFMMLKKARKIVEIVRFSSMWNLDGIVIIGFCEDEYQDLRDRIRVPFVTYDGVDEAQSRWGNVTVDDHDGGRQVGAYLRELGHSRVLCISDNEVHVDWLRYQGLNEGLGQKADFLLIPMQESQRIPFYAERLGFIRKHTAVFAVSDHYAAELMWFLQGHGVGVPEEISVVGYDGSKEALNALPRLTTVVQDNRLRAQTAVGLLMRMIDDTADELNLCIPVRLSEGDSVKNLSDK